MHVNLWRRAGAFLAGIATVVVMTATPAVAAGGWFVHSGGYPGDVFGDMPCLDRGAELYAADEIQGFYCAVNQQNGLWDLWAIQGTWVYHSRHYDIWDCFDAGDIQKAAGNAHHFDCRSVQTPAWRVDLYLLPT